mgnify:CR=1 FL=1
MELFVSTCISELAGAKTGVAAVRTVTGWLVLAGASVDVSAKNLCQGVAGAEPIISNFTWLKVVS